MTASLRLLRLPEVIERTGLSRSTIYSQVAQGLFPQIVKLGLRSSAWVESEVNSWLSGRIAVRDAIPA